MDRFRRALLAAALAGLALALVALAFLPPSARAPASHLVAATSAPITPAPATASPTHPPPSPTSAPTPTPQPQIAVRAAAHRHQRRDHLRMFEREINQSRPAHRAAHKHSALNSEMAHQSVEVLAVREIRLINGRFAVAAHIIRDDAKMRRERLDLMRPQAMVGNPRVDEHKRLPAAGDFTVKLACY